MDISIARSRTLKGDDLYVDGMSMNGMSMNGPMNVEEGTRDRQVRVQSKNIDIPRLLNSYQNM